MIQEEKKKHENLIIKTINYLKKLGYTEIKADVDGYDSPTSFEVRGKDMKVTPDIVSTNPNGKVQYVEVGVKTERPVLLKSKWKLLKTLSELKNRGFRIITHRGHYSFTDKIVNELDPQLSSQRI